MTKNPLSFDATRYQPFLSEETLVDCGIEAAGDHRLARTEIEAIYKGIQAIDRFIRKLRVSHDPKELVDLVCRGNRDRYEWSGLGRDFMSLIARAYGIGSDLSALTPFLKAHPSVQALMDASMAAGMSSDDFGSYQRLLPASDVQARDRVTTAFQSLTAPANLNALHKSSNNLRRNCNKKFNSLKRYLLTLIKHFKRVLVIRLDLYYGQKFSMNLKDCTHERISADRVAFLDMIRRDYPAFVGYAWKLEVGIQRRWHLHTLLCFDGDEVCNDIIIGRILGDAWVKLTNGKGDYYNCNAKRAGYKFDAIGMVRESNQAKVDDLMEYPATYLTKPDYFIGLELPNGRSFGKGQILRAWATNIKAGDSGRAGELRA